MAAPESTPLFAPGFSTILEACIGRQLRKVDEVIRKVDQILATAELEQCAHEELADETNGFRCSETATVHDLAAERNVCAKHLGSIR